MTLVGAIASCLAAVCLILAIGGAVDEYLREKQAYAIRFAGPMPANWVVGHLGRRLSPLSGPLRPLVRAIDARLARAGRPFGGLGGRELVGLAMAGGLVGASAAMLVASQFVVRPWREAVGLIWLPPLIPVLTVGLLYYAVSQKAQRQAEAVWREFPYFLDLMLLVLQAGGRPPRAIDIYISTRKGSALAKELEVLRSELETLDFQEAMRRLETRVANENVRVVLRNVGQAVTAGTGLTGYVIEQAEELRFIRSELAERAAERLHSSSKLPEFLMVMAIALLLVAPAIVELSKAPL